MRNKIRILVFLAMTITTLAAAGSEARAMSLLLAFGTPGAEQVTKTVMEERAKQTAEIEPAAGGGQIKQEQRQEQLTED